MSLPHHPEYVRLAHERGMLVALARHVEAEYLPTDISDTPKSVVVCDNLAREVGEVPRESWAAIVSKLERMAQARSAEMSKYVQVLSDTQSNLEEESEIVPRKEASPPVKQPPNPQAKPQPRQRGGHIAANGGAPAGGSQRAGEGRQR